MRAKDIMTTNVITVSPETPIREIAQQLLRHHISALPVVNSEGGLVGIVSEADLMHRAETGTERHRSCWLALLADPEQLAHDYVKSHGTRAADLMSRDVVSVTPETPVAEIPELLEKRGIRRVPVVREGRLVGIVSRADLLRGLAAARQQAEVPALADNAAIRRQVLQALRSADWAMSAYIKLNSVVVTDGVVELWGLVNSEAQAEAARVAASGVPGVRAIEDHLAKIPAGAWAE